VCEPCWELVKPTRLASAEKPFFVDFPGVLRRARCGACSV